MNIHWLVTVLCGVRCLAELTGWCDRAGRVGARATERTDDNRLAPSTTLDARREQSRRHIFQPMTTSLVGWITHYQLGFGGNRQIHWQQHQATHLIELVYIITNITQFHLVSNCLMINDCSLKIIETTNRTIILKYEYIIIAPTPCFQKFRDSQTFL